MSAATFITNTTPGAPVLSGSEGSLSALFRYLAPVLGWDIIFDSGLVIVIQPQPYRAGQALLYRVDDRTARGGSAPRVAQISAYESMSNIDTGSGLIGPVYIHKSYYANTTGYSYNIAGDQYGFFIQAQCYYAAGANPAPISISYLGFLNPLLVSDIPICALFADYVDGISKGGGNMIYANPASSVSRGGLFIHKSRSGSLNIAVANYSSGAMDLDTHAMGSTGKSTAYDNTGLKYLPSLGYTLGAKIYTNDGAAYSVSGVVPAMAPQSSETEGFTCYNTINCGESGGTYGGAWNYGRLLIPNDESFRP